MDYTDLSGLNGQDNQGGTTQIVYYAPLSYFLAIQGFDATPDIDGVLQIITAHTFKVGKGFHKLYTTMDTGKLAAELTGERDGHGYGIKLECFHPGGKKEAAAFARKSKNDQFIILVKSPNGETFQLGTQELFAEISGKYDSGTLSSGRNGWSFTVSSYANGLIYYDSLITLFPGA
jgi:hypothetical protein